METKDKRWIVQFEVGSAVIVSVPKTERYATVIVIYVRKDGTPDTKHFLDDPERAFEQAKAWVAANIGAIQSIEEYQLEG